MIQVLLKFIGLYVGSSYNHHHQVVFHKYRPSLLNWHRARFAGHCYGSKDQIISDVICMRFPRTSRGRRPLHYIDCITRDINQDINDLPNLMTDRVSWQSIVNSFSVASAWWSNIWSQSWNLAYSCHRKKLMTSSPQQITLHMSKIEKEIGEQTSPSGLLLR